MKASKDNHRRPHPVPMYHRLCTALVLVLAMTACAGSAWAQRNDAPQSYSISAGSLADALDQLAAQSKVQIIYPADLVRGMRSPVISGRQDWRQALGKLLGGSGLEWQLVNETTVAIRKAPSSGLPVSFDFDIPAGDLGTALNFFSSQSGIEVLYPADELAGKQGRALRGRMPWPDALAKLLQGSGFGYRRAADGSVVIERTAVAPSPEATTLGAVEVTGTRIRGGTSASPVITIDSKNIREEGFTDLGEVIRSIPQNFRGGQNPGVAQGADVGAAGIANRNATGGSSLNLRGLGPDASLTLLNGRRFAYGGYTQTVDISAIPVEAVDRVEVVADGASAIYGSDAVGGVANVILRRDYDGATIGARYGAASGGGMGTREYTATAGTAWSNGGFIATYKRASVDPIRTDQRDYTAGMLSPATLYPGSELRSGLLSLHQSLGQAMELRLDALHTGRDQRFYSYYSGVTSIYSRFEPQTRTTLVAPALEVSLPHDWQVSLGASWGRDETTSQEFRISTTTGEGARSPYDDCFCNENRTYEVGAEGPLFHLGGGDARLAVGAGYRWNGFVDRLLTTGEDTTQGAVGSRFAYAELGMPLLGGGGAAGDRARLSLTAALRREDYDGFGSVTTPKLGLVYDPTGDFTLKASWGRSFKAPTLLQRFQDKVAALYPAAVVGGDPGRTVIATAGGNPLLQPERARTWTASLALHPRALPALEAELSLFNIEYADRVVQPISNYAEALTNPIYSRYVIPDPTVEQQDAVVDSTVGFYNYSGVPYDPVNVEAVVFTHFVNVARQHVHGVDLSGSYGLDAGAGRLELRGSASWLESEQKNGPDDAAFDLAGTLFSPAKLNGRAGLVWLQGGVTASAFVNYTSGVRDALTGFETASFTTADANLRYSLDDSVGARSGWDFVLSAQNLFDRPPPLHPTLDPSWAPYDSTNYSAIGRYLSVSVARRF